MKKLFTLWRRLLWVLPLFTFFLVITPGCNRYGRVGLYPQVDATDISPSAGNYPKIPANQIIVYPSAKFAPKRFLLVARLKSGWASYCPSEEDLLEEFRKKAAELGADAVIVSEITIPGGKGVEIKTGLAPTNDLGYVSNPRDVGITQVISQPSKDRPSKGNFKGYALAIRSKP